MSTIFAGVRQLFLPVDLLLKTLLSCTGPIAGDVLLSVIVIGELLYGFRRGSLIERNVAELRSFLDNPYVSLVTVGPATADRYSRIATSLRAKGRPIPTNDIWIAAQAMETGADLVSADRHFEHVDGVVWINVSAD